MMVLSKTFSEPPLSFKMAASTRKCQLCAIGMKIYSFGYFNVVDMMEILKYFSEPPLFSKLSPYREISTLSDFNENLDHGVI